MSNFIQPVQPGVLPARKARRLTTGMYHAHRENQREWILEVAQDLFIQKGIDVVSMGEIADAARLTRATIYRYFNNKEQIALEIFKVITRGWAERNQREVWNAPGSGRVLIERFLRSHFNYLLQTPHEAGFVAEFNHLYSRQWPVEAVKGPIADTLGAERQRLLESIQAGQIDGSLRGDIQAGLILAAIFNFTSGMLNRLGEMGSKIDAEYELGSSAIFNTICQIFLDGLKPPPEP